VCMPALVMLLLLFIIVVVRTCAVAALLTIFCLWRSGGDFLPTGGAISFDSDFWHFWRRSRFFTPVFFPLLLLSSLSSSSATGGCSPLSSGIAAPREFSLAHGMVLLCILTPQDLLSSGSTLLVLDMLPAAFVRRRCIYDGGFIGAPVRITSTIF